MTVFDSFIEEPYTFLAIKRGGVRGNTIKRTATYMGVFKLRNGGSRAGNIEERSSTATLHVHPEDYCEPYDKLVGQGIEKDGVFYEISSLTGGKNFSTGELEHLTLTLNIADYAEENS